MKVRCNGLKNDVNDVDVEKALRETPILRGDDVSQSAYPERVVLRCRHCTDGKVIITRKMLEEFYGDTAARP